MGTTRNHYEHLVLLFDKICKITDSDIDELNLFKSELNSLINQIIKLHLFPLFFSDEFYECVSNSTLNFYKEQRLLAKEIYTCLGMLLFSFENTNRDIDYVKTIEVCRTELPFSQAKEWNIESLISPEYESESLFFNLNSSWLGIKTEDEYINYKELLRKDYKNQIGLHIDQSIDINIYKNIENFFIEKIATYRNFIKENYPSIQDEFTGFSCNIRIYVIPHIYNKENDIGISVNFYKDINGNNVYIHPLYLDFNYRFSNHEDIEAKPVSGYMSLFNEKYLDKYENYFSIKNIFFELNRIFIYKASFKDLKDYLIYILRGRMYSIVETDENSVILIKEKGIERKCKIFFNNVPNIEQFRTILENSFPSFSYVVFKFRPDNETIKFLNENFLEYFVLEELGSSLVNNRNGEMIHWFIKERLKNDPDTYTNNNFQYGDSLIKRLETCQSGTAGWLDYENICTDIFKFLFENDFRKYTFKYQSYTYDKIFRRDLVINNNFSDPTSFWAQVKADFNCNLVIVDFKNYTDPLEQNEFYSPSKYLNVNTGKFAIICSRKGLGNSAKILQRRMFGLDNELILCLDDNDLIGMIKEKINKQDPTYRLENLKFSLYELI